MGGAGKLKNAFFVLIVLTCSSLAHGQMTAANNAGKSPNTLTCSPAPCVLPNVQVASLMYGAVPRSLATNPSNTNDMVLATTDGNCFSGGEGFYSSRDGGATWPGHSCIFSNQGGGATFAGYDLNNRVFGGGLDDLTAILVRYSDNNGVLWSRAKVADGSEGFGAFWPQLAIDTSMSSPFKNSIYISSTHGGGLEGGYDTRVFVSHSSDGGQHWKSVPLDQWQTPSTDFFPRLSVGEDGTVYATWMRCSRPQFGFCVKDGVPVYLSKSTDGGTSWTSPALVATTNLVSPDNCLYGCLPNVSSVFLTNEPVNAVVGSGPAARVYVVFYNWTGTQMQVEVVTSTDGGKTFGSPIRVSDSNVGDQFLPWISVAADGTIAVSWLDRRNDPANVKYQPFLATSKDGKSFTRSVRLASFLNDPSPFSGGFLEPNPTLWLGSAIYATWTDFRTGFARAELGGVQF